MPFEKERKLLLLGNRRLKEGFRLTTDVASLGTQVGNGDMTATNADSAQERRFEFGPARRTGKN